MLVKISVSNNPEMCRVRSKSLSFLFMNPTLFSMLLLLIIWCIFFQVFYVFTRHTETDTPHTQTYIKLGFKTIIVQLYHVILLFYYWFFSLKKGSFHLFSRSVHKAIPQYIQVFHMALHNRFNQFLIGGPLYCFTFFACVNNATVSCLTKITFFTRISISEFQISKRYYCVKRYALYI